MITNDDFKSYMGIEGSARDARVTLVVNGVVGIITELTERAWSNAARDERYPGTDSTALVLKHYPVTAMTEVTVDDVVVESDDYQLDAVNGILYRIDGVWIKTIEHLIRARYNGGPSAAPADLILAALEVSGFVWRSWGGRQTVKDGTVSVGLVGKALNELPFAKEAIERHADSARGFLVYSAGA